MSEPFKPIEDTGGLVRGYAKTIPNAEKVNKAEPKEVSLIDLLIEIRALKGELRQLRREFNEHKASDPNRRIG